jgi:hypothetical protein
LVFTLLEGGAAMRTSQSRLLPPILLLAALFSSGADTLHAQTISITAPNDNATFAHGTAYPTITGICSQANVSVKISAKNTWNDGVLRSRTQTVTVTTDATGMFAFTPVDFTLNGTGGSATWEVKVWLVSDPTVIDTHDGSVTAPPPPP